MGRSHEEGDNFSAAMQFSQKLVSFSLNVAIQVNFCHKLLNLSVVLVFNKIYLKYSLSSLFFRLFVQNFSHCQSTVTNKPTDPVTVEISQNLL